MVSLYFSDEKTRLSVSLFHCILESFVTFSQYPAFRLEKILSSCLLLDYHCINLRVPAPRLSCQYIQVSKISAGLPAFKYIL